MENLTQVMVIYHSGLILSGLSSINTCNLSELLQISGLTEMDFYIALGYLLCEGKIAFSGKMVVLKAEN